MKLKYCSKNTFEYKIFSLWRRFKYLIGHKVIEPDVSSFLSVPNKTSESCMRVLLWTTELNIVAFITTNKSMSKSIQ